MYITLVQNVLLPMLELKSCTYTFLKYDGCSSPPLNCSHQKTHYRKISPSKICTTGLPVDGGRHGGGFWSIYGWGAKSNHPYVIDVYTNFIIIKPMLMSQYSYILVCWCMSRLLINPFKFLSLMTWLWIILKLVFLDINCFFSRCFR
jgi:hypothetical protein